MTIAINSVQYLPFSHHDYFLEYFGQVATAEAGHRFIFIVSNDCRLSWLEDPDFIKVMTSPKRTEWNWKAWLYFGLPTIARMYKADLVINTGGMCSSRIHVPQWLCISDLSHLSSPRLFTQRVLRFRNRWMPAFIRRAGTILVPSVAIKNVIAANYATDHKNIHVIQLLPSAHFKPLEWQEKEDIKDKYSGGKEYFLFSGEIEGRVDLIHLLKAFSFFKKRQRSNMQMVIACAGLAAGHSFIKELNTYKYRDDVKLLAELPEAELAAVTAAAYAFIYPCVNEGTALMPLRAMQCGVPVITSDMAAILEIARDTVLYADPSSFEDIADKMMLLFKDEVKRAGMIRKANELVLKIAVPQTAQALRDLLPAAFNRHP